MIKAVVFDLDDTLYDASSCYAEGTRCLAAFAKDTFGMPSETFHRYFLQARSAVKSRLDGTAACHNRLLYIQMFLEIAGELPAIRAVEMYNAYWEGAMRVMEPYPYALPLLRKLRERGVRVAVLSDLTAYIQHRKLIRLGFAPYVDTLVTSEEAGAEKPSEKMFALVMEKTAADAGELLMVGDSLERDIAGASAVGMPSICYQKGMDITKEVERYL